MVKVVNLYGASVRNVSKVLRYNMHCREISQFYLHTAFHAQGQ